MASLLSGFDEDKQRLSPHSNYGIPSSSGFASKMTVPNYREKGGADFGPPK